MSLIPIIPAPEQRARLSKVGTTQNNSIGDTTVTFSSMDIGAADSNRRIFAAIATAQGDAITSVTLGGNAMTIHLNANDNPISNVIASILIPSGTAADLVINTSSAMAGAYATLYRMIYESYLEIVTTPDDTLTVTGNDASPSGSIDVEENGFVIVNSAHERDVVTTISITGVDEDDQYTIITGTAADKGRSGASELLEQQSLAVGSTVGGSGTTDTVFHALSWH